MAKTIIIWCIVVLAAAAVAAWWLYGLPHVAPSRAGEVASIDKENRQLTVRVIVLQKKNDGVEHSSYYRNVNITPSSAVLAVSQEGTVPVLNENPLDFFKIGDLVTVYAYGEPQAETAVSADKIEIAR